MKYDQFYPKPSKVTRNKNLKTISVKNSFDCNQIPIKIIASYQIWKRLEQKFLENDGLIDLGIIRPFIKAPRKNIQALERYCNESPEEFSWHFYYYYIEYSKVVNPLVVTKERGGSPYGLSWREMLKIRMTTRHLYVCLNYWLRKPQKEHPPEITKLLKAYTLENTTPLTATMEIMIQHYPHLNKIESTTFYDEYIAYKELDTLKEAYRKINYLPLRILLRMDF